MHPSSIDPMDLTDRQRMVLRAVVSAFLADAQPVGSKTLSHLLSVKLSSASIRNTMAELTALELIEKSHASSGRIPTEKGLRLFVDSLLSPSEELESYQRRALAHSFDEVAGEGVVQLASQILSSETRQLGFVVAPRLKRVVLRHVSFVRLSSEQVLVVLVSRDGQAHRLVIEDARSGDQADLEATARMLNERLLDRTLFELRDALEAELRTLRDRAGGALKRALSLGLRAIELSEDATPGLVIASHLALLGQPEFDDAERIRELFSAVEMNEHLVEMLDQILETSQRDVAVALGADFEEAALRRFALVASAYGDERSRLGVLGVIGPNRMDYARIIPLVSYCSQMVSEKLSA